MRIVAISGSLQASSSNTALLRVAATVAPDGVTVELYDGIRALPHFDPDLDGPEPPPGIADLRARIVAADAVLFSTPGVRPRAPWRAEGHARLARRLR